VKGRLWRTAGAPSLRRQLAVVTALVLLALGAATTAGAWLLVTEFQSRIAERSIRDAVERLVAAVSLGAEGIYLDTTRVDAAYKRPLSGEYFVIDSSAGRWRSRSLWDWELAVPESSQRGPVVELAGPADQQLLVLTRKFRRFGQPLAITAATDIAPLRTEFRRLLLIFTLAWAVALSLALVALYLWMGHSLQSLARVRRQVAAIQKGERQALDEQGPLELLPMISQINHLLEEIRLALLRSRKALGNLGHALKTPLAVLYTLVEREDIRRQPELYHALREQLHQIDKRILRELGQIQGGIGGGVGEPFVPARDLPGLVGALEQAHGRHLAVSWHAAEDLRLPFDRADILELLGNLLDNAYKWARGRVAVTIRAEGGSWLLAVADDGPGIPDADLRAKVLRRGQRLDETVAGQGLGLAIVGDMVDAWGGDLVLASGPLGGLEVRVTLPVRRPGFTASAGDGMVPP